MSNCVHANASGSEENGQFVIRCNDCGAELHRS